MYNNAKLPTIISFNFKDIDSVNSPREMISEDEINQELGRLEDFIINRIKVIKDVINDEDRWVA